MLQGGDADATAKLFSDPKVRVAFMTYIKKIYPTYLSNEDKQQLQKLGTYAQKQMDSGVAEESR